MVRIFGFLAGCGFVAALLFSLFTTPLSNEPNAIHAFHKHARPIKLASDGPFGGFSKNQAQLQRGMQVYKEVCSACHSLNLVAFRDIKALGYDDGQVKAFAKEFQVASLNPDTGEPATRPGNPTDYFPAPYPNEVAARAANNGASPPDLSLMAKAREGGKNYIYSLLTGYTNPPANLPKELRPGTGLHYNPYFANLNLAMAKPLNDGQVTFADGSKNDVDHMARDLTAFLVWAAEPKLEARNQAGWPAFLFLLIFTVLAYLSYRNIWADKKH